MSCEDGGGPGVAARERRVWLPDEEATVAFGKALGARLGRARTVVLVGDLGAGKTCLARGLAQGLGVADPEAVHSPTYLLVVEHPGPVPMLHLDAYLPEKTRAFLEDGGADYLAESGGVVVAEWGDRVADLLPRPMVEVLLQPEPRGGVVGREAIVRDPAGVIAGLGELGRGGQGDPDPR